MLKKAIAWGCKNLSVHLQEEQTEPNVSIMEFRMTHEAVNSLMLSCLVCKISKILLSS